VEGCLPPYDVHLCAVHMQCLQNQICRQRMKRDKSATIGICQNLVFGRIEFMSVVVESLQNSAVTESSQNSVAAESLQSVL